MFSNKEILKDKKSFLKSSALIAMPNIVLAPEEADQFIDLCVDQSYWMNGNARIVKMDKNEMNVRYADFDTSKRFLFPESGFSSADYTKTFLEGKITLTSKKFRGCVVLYDSDIEDALDGQDFADMLMKLIAKRVSNELDEAFYVSNTTSTGFIATDIRHMDNGFRYNLLNFTASSGTVPTAAWELDGSSTGDFAFAGNIAVQNTAAPYNIEYKFKKMLSTLPNKYKGDFANLRYYANPNVSADYAEILQERGTPLGDSAILGKNPMQFGGVPIVGVPQMPVTYAPGSAGTENFADTSSTGYQYTDCILTNKDNFVIGLHRSLTLESQRVAADEATYVFYSIRVCTQIQNPDCAVILHTLTNG